ncbi:hypothetical protein P3342_004740 [Pyrenophora teres f. teres]|nr:hypothetical protein P3342_004740 [Pyrenophora teres f. teres]
MRRHLVFVRNKWEGYGCCGVATPGPADAPAEWCENLPLVENGHRGFMLCCIQADLQFGNGPDGYPIVCQNAAFLNPQYITQYAGMELCESGGQEGFRACARRNERYLQ